MTNNIYENTHRSILAYLKNFNETQLNGVFQIFDFDEHSVTHDWPNDKDLLGIKEYSMEISDNTYICSCMIIVSTMANDRNFSRARPVVGKLSELLTSGKHIDVVNATGTKISTAVIMQDILFASASKTSDVRPVIPIGISLAVSKSQ